MINTEVLQTFLSNPLNAYLVMLAGIPLVILECVRPGRVLPGVFGSVCVTTGATYLFRANLSFAGVLVTSGCVLALPLARRFDSLGVWLLLSFAFGLGSSFLVEGRTLPVFHCVAAATVYLALFWCLRIALFARHQKRRADVH